MYVEDFLELEKIIKNHIMLNPNYKDSFKIRLVTHNRDIQENTFESIPNTENIKTLWIDATGWEKSDIIQVVNIVFSKNYCEISTRGDNEVWTRGLQQKLEEFIISKQTLFNKHSSKFQNLISLFLGVFLGVFLIKVIASLNSHVILHIFMNILGLLIIISLIYLNLKVSSSRFTVLSLGSKNQKSKKSLSRSEWITIIGVIIPIIISFIF